MPSAFATPHTPRGRDPGRFWAAMVLLALLAMLPPASLAQPAAATAALAASLQLPPGVSPDEVSIAILACDEVSARPITAGRPILDAAGALTASYTIPGPSAQVLLRITYPDAPGGPPRTILLAPEPGRITAPLPVGPSPASAGSASVPLNPSEHGFRFVNRFTASPLPMLERTLGIRLDAFGLCGGMSFAAADLFLASRPRPDADTPPPAGSPLYEYIYRRQIDSLGGLAIQGARFALWMDLPTGGIAGVRKRSFDELTAIRASLDAGVPVVLGLVYVSARDRRPAWNNHQVLAYAYEAGGDRISFRIYDPNYPGRDDVTIRADVRTEGGIDDPARPGAVVPILGLECRQWLGPRSLRPVRGLFAMPYTPADPPADLSPTPRPAPSAPSAPAPPSPPFPPPLHHPLPAL